MVHSSFRSLGPTENGPDTLIDALQDAVGPQGTVLYPTFNFKSWTEQHYWDAEETPSDMGALTEFARLRPGARRSPHPIYSFAALGAQADAFAACDDPEAYGDDSVFGLFHRLDGRILSFGLHFNSTFSMHHYVERVVGVDYRRPKRFAGLYLKAGEEAQVKTYTMYVRNGPSIKTWIVPGMEALVRQGDIQAGHVGESTVHHARASVFFDAMSKVVRAHPEWLHEQVDPRRTA